MLRTRDRKKQEMKSRLTLILLFICLAITQGACAQVPEKGVWISVFSSKRVHYSRQAINELLKNCKEAGISQIYFQVYQSGRAFYNSRICAQPKYKEMLLGSGTDTLDYLLREARKNKIKVFAWVNILSLGTNPDADILKKLGPGILTLDQYGRPSGRKDPNDSDKYYLRDEHLFLEPGDPRVAKYIFAIVDEVVTRYPQLSGVHLDYVRYPMTVPFSPGSRFKNYGINYGYGREDIRRLREASGLDPFTLNKDKDFSSLDNWRRQQVTDLVRNISRQVKLRSSGMLVSCAVIPAHERAYSSMFQDWPGWLQEGIVDYVVLMNYTLDNQLAKEISRAAISLRQQGKVYVGMGVFLMKDDPAIFKEQYKALNLLNPDGIVFFAYDDITPDLLMYIGGH